METFKLISKNGDFLPLMLRMSHEGATVKAYLDNHSKMYDGMLPKAEDIVGLDITAGDIVIYDMVGGGEGADILKDKGYTVIGAGKLNDKLELDRDFGTNFLLEHGIKCPPTWVFKEGRDDIHHFLNLNEDVRFVFKPCNNLDTSLTYVSTSWKNMNEMIDYLIDQLPDDSEFQMQEFVEGTEMSTEAWFNGTHFIQPINSTMEEKRFMSGNYGPNTGCMGNVVWCWPEEASEFLYHYLFEPLEDSLQEAGYLGPLDINGIWNDEGIHALELTARFGYDAIQALSLLIEEPLSELLGSLNLEGVFPVYDTGRAALTVRVSIPPFPLEGEVPEIPLGGFTSRRKKNYFPSDVCLKKGKPYCAGTDGYIVTVGATGKSIEAVRTKVYELIDVLEIPDKQVRNDIGERYIHERDSMEYLLQSLAATP